MTYLPPALNALPDGNGSTRWNELTDWIAATDAHAGHRLRLLEQARAALSWPAASAPSSATKPTASSVASPAAASSKRIELAGKIERWRYQQFNEYAGAMTPQSEALADALDDLGRRLAGRTAQPPRQTRHAVFDSRWETESIREACAMLDPSYPTARLVERARQLTREHFGHTAGEPGLATDRRRMFLYAPLYVSSYCVNDCVYCGFRFAEQIPRRHLTAAEALDQAQILRQRGFEHLLVVASEFPSRTTTAYYAEIARALAGAGFESSFEVAPQATEDYAQLVAAGVCALTLYQETYDRTLYARYHRRGPKSFYDWRLESHDRAAEAGMPRLGLGILLGLAEPHADFVAMLRHAAYLADRFPDRTLAISLPRLHEAPEGFEAPFVVSDELLVRFYCAARVAFPRAVLVLSTREQVELRNQLARICITQMSAGSSTVPGGYSPDADAHEAGEQFPVSDHRSPTEVADWLRHEGFEIAWRCAT